MASRAIGLTNSVDPLFFTSFNGTAGVLALKRHTGPGGSCETHPNARLGVEAVKTLL